MIKENQYIWKCDECGFTKPTQYLPRKECPVCEKEVYWRGMKKVINKEK